MLRASEGNRRGDGGAGSCPVSGAYCLLDAYGRPLGSEICLTDGHRCVRRTSSVEVVGRNRQSRMRRGS